MRETWLKTNRRAIGFAIALPAIVIAMGAWLSISRWSNAAPGWRWLGAAMVAAGVVSILLLLRQLAWPRVSYADGNVEFYLRRGRPIAVPVRVVEAFFLGQGPATLPAGIGRKEEAVNLVARLSQRNVEWSQQDVKPALGRWCDGYVTIRGTWCERLNGELIRRLNRRLKEVKTELEEATAVR